MGVAYSIRRGIGVGLPVPETSFEKLGPMLTTKALKANIRIGKGCDLLKCTVPSAKRVHF